MYTSLYVSNIVLYFAKNLHRQILHQRENDLKYDILQSSKEDTSSNDVVEGFIPQITIPKKNN